MPILDNERMQSGGIVSRPPSVPGPSSATANALKEIARAIGASKKQEAAQTERQEARGLSAKAYENAPDIVVPQDNYNTGVQDAVRVGAASPEVISGLDGGRKGRYFLFVNKGAENITIEHLGSGSDPENRVFCPGGNDLVVSPGTAVQFWYDWEDELWRVISGA